MSVVNAFNWKEYTEQERVKNGDPFKQIKLNAVISANTTEGVHKFRKTNPSHGTIHGLTDKRLSLKQPDMMETKRAKTKK